MERNKEDSRDINKMKENVSFYAKIIQSLFLALFLYGFSNSIGDLVPTFGIPISSFSIATTVYGLLGMIACEFVSRRFDE